MTSPEKSFNYDMTRQLHVKDFIEEEKLKIEIEKNHALTKLDEELEQALNDIPSSCSDSGRIHQPLRREEIAESIEKGNFPYIQFMEKTSRIEDVEQDPDNDVIQALNY